MIPWKASVASGDSHLKAAHLFEREGLTLLESPPKIVGRPWPAATARRGLAGTRTSVVHLSRVLTVTFAPLHPAHGCREEGGGTAHG